MLQYYVFYVAFYAKREPFESFPLEFLFYYKHRYFLIYSVSVLTNYNGFERLAERERETEREKWTCLVRYRFFWDALYNKLERNGASYQLPI